jgi:hypothetical protein
MIRDASLIFAEQQVVTASAASAASTAVTPNCVGIVDLGLPNSGRNIGVGSDKLYLVVTCTADMTDASSDTTIAASLRTSATAASGALTGTITTILTLAAFPALTKKGTMIYGVLPSAAYKQYLDVYFTAANGNLTTGNFSAFICTNVPDQAYYAEGFNPQ